MYDVAIVGAGPAGSTLARLLAGKFRVLLLDRHSSAGSSGRGKLCGGLLAPAAQKELARQGLGVPSEILAGPQLFAVRAVDSATGLERRYQRHYLNIDRPSFDSWLLSQARPFCDVREGWRLLEVQPAEDSVLLRVQTAEGADASVAARLVVGADGAGSVVRRTMYGQRAAATYTAIQATYRSCGGEACFGALFSALTDHYGWVVPKGDTVLAGAAFRRESGSASRFDVLVGELREAGFELGEELWRGSTPLVRPTRTADVRLGHRRIALVGEAASLISPSSAEGISYALRSAAALAAGLELAPQDPVYEYRRFARPLVAEVLGKVAKSHLLRTPAVRRAALLTGVGSLPENEIDGFAGALGELLAP